MTKDPRLQDYRAVYGVLALVTDYVPVSDIAKATGLGGQRIGQVGHVLSSMGCVERQVDVKADKGMTPRRYKAIREPSDQELSLMIRMLGQSANRPKDKVLVPAVANDSALLAQQVRAEKRPYNAAYERSASQIKADHGRGTSRRTLVNRYGAGAVDYALGTKGLVTA